MSLITHTTALADYMTANIPDLKDAYPHVTLAQTKNGEWPVYWCEGWNEGKPLLGDYQRNYLYFRQYEEASADEFDVSSRTSSYLVRYPVRMVVHYRINGEDQTRAYLNAYKQMLVSYRFESKSVRLQLNGSEYIGERVFTQEVSGSDFKSDRKSMLISIDFNIIEQQIAGQCLPDIFCGSDGTAALIYPYQS